MRRMPAKVYDAWILVSDGRAVRVGRTLTEAERSLRRGIDMSGQPIGTPDAAPVIVLSPYDRVYIWNPELRLLERLEGR